MVKRLLIVALIAVVACSNFAFAAKKTVVRFQDWHMSEDVWMQCLKELKAEYEKLNPDVTIEFEPVSLANKAQRFTIASEARNAPDVVHCEFVDLAPYVDKGYLLDLSGFIKKEPKNFMKQWADSAVKLSQFNGKTYAMPDDAQTIVMFYNTELYKKAGLDPNKPPKTWTEFRDYAKKLTTDGQWGFGMVGDKSTSLIQRLLPVIWSFGGDIFNENMTKCVLDSPDSIAGFKFYIELSTKDGVVPPGPTEMSAQNVRTFASQSKVAMKFGSGWTVSIIDALNPALKAREVLRAAPMPVGKEKVTFAVMDFWGISAYTKHKDAAWSWVKFLTSKESTTKMFKDNGVTSSRIDVAESEIIKNDKFASVVSSQIPYGRPAPRFIALNEVNDALIVATQQALIKQKTPEEAMKEAAAKINQIIARNKK